MFFLLCHKISKRSIKVFFSLKFLTPPDKNLKQLEFSFTILRITEIMSMNKFSQLRKKKIIRHYTCGKATRTLENSPAPLKSLPSYLQENRKLIFNIELKNWFVTPIAAVAPIMIQLLDGNRYNAFLTRYC